jgi:hypothetical protein
VPRFDRPHVVCRSQHCVYTYQANPPLAWTIFEEGRRSCGVDGLDDVSALGVGFFSRPQLCLVPICIPAPATQLLVAVEVVCDKCNHL